MKYLITTLLCLASINYAIAQGKTKDSNLSNAEVFSSKAGTLIQKEFVNVGSIKKAEIQVIHYTDMISYESISSVQLEYETGGTYSDTKIASLDSDEIDGLLKSISIMQESVFSTSPTNYTEVTYKSRGGFQAGCYWSDKSWSTYIKLEEHDSKSYVFLKKSDFPTLVSLLAKAKSLLN